MAISQNQPRMRLPSLTQDPRAEQLRAWLTATRELAAGVLACGYETPQAAPKRLHPKSPAWRIRQILARPLQADERQDLEVVVDVADRWLELLANGPDGTTVALLSQAMHREQAMGRSQAALLFRVVELDQGDARRSRNGNLALQAGSQAKRCKATLQQLEQEAERLLKRNPEMKSKVLYERVASKFDLSASRVRHRLQSSPSRPTRK